MLLSSSATKNIVRGLNRTNRSLNQSIERVSTGLRINRSSNDATGSAIASNLKARSRSLRVAERNAHQGIAASQIADGATSSVTDNLKRMRELAVQASSATLNNDERAYLHDEQIQLVQEIDRVAQNTRYSDVDLANGSSATLSIQVGSGNTIYDRIEMELGDLRSATLGVDSLDFTTTSGAQSALATIDTAIQSTLGYRASYGATQNRLGFAANNLATQYSANASATERIVSADIAYEASEMARLRVIQQAGMAALGQATQIDRDTTASLLGANSFEEAAGFQ